MHKYTANQVYFCKIHAIPTLYAISPDILTEEPSDSRLDKKEFANSMALIESLFLKLRAGAPR